MKGLDKKVLTSIVVLMNTLILIVSIDMFASYFIFNKKVQVNGFCFDKLAWTCPEPSRFFYWRFLGLSLRNFLNEREHYILSFDRLEKDDHDNIMRPWTTRKNKEMQVELPWEDGVWVDYSYDDFGRRVADDIEKGVENSSFVFLGGSWVHGDYLPYEDSLPGKFQKVSKHRTYNYGIQGGGLQEAFLWTHSADFSASIPEANNTFIYTHLSFHPSRLRPSIFRGSQNFSSMSADYLTPRKLGYAGSFYQSYPVLAPSLAFLYYSGLGKILKLQNKVYPEWENETLFCDMLIQMKEKLKERRPDSDFYVLSYESSLKDFFLSCLSNNGIKKILPFIDTDLTETSLPDGHPNAQTHEFVAKYIKEQITSSP